MAENILEHTIRRHADGQTVTATVRGDWDYLTDCTLVEQLRAVIEEGYRNVVVDAQLLTFCDSTCLGALVGLHHAVVTRGGWLRIAAPPYAVRRPMALTGLDQLIQITDGPLETGGAPHPR